MTGDYTIVATNDVTDCIETMSGNEIIIENPLPTIYNLTVSANEYCAGSGGIDLTLDGTDSDVTYQVYDSETPTGITLAGTGSTITFTGLMAGNYTIVATNDVTGCTETMSGNEIIIETPTYEFITTESICEGESYEWRGNIYSEADIYIENYSTVGSDCDSIYTLDLTVNPLPQQVVILTNPSDGILDPDTNGEISLSTSIIGTDYWVTMGAALYTAATAGTGSSLMLGSSYPAGTFDIWSSTEHGCELLQGSVTFVEDNGNNNLTANISFGTPATNFPTGEAVVSLFKLTTDIEMNEVIILDQQQTLGSNGQVIFEDIEPGDYYLGSALVNPDNYNVASHVYYQTAITHENAISIPMTESTIFVADMHHPQLAAEEGSNSGGGVVGEGGSKSELTPLANMVVILRNADADEIIDVCVTNTFGEYSFPFIPDNTNIQMYVTSFEHQQWIPFSVLTETGTEYEVDFVVNGEQVYPDGWSSIGNLSDVGDIQIFPNPTKDILYIKGESINNVSITSLEGKLILSKTDVNSNYLEIDLSNYAKGIYLVKIMTNKGEKIEKLILE